MPSTRHVAYRSDLETLTDGVTPVWDEALGRWTLVSGDVFVATADYQADRDVIVLKYQDLTGGPAPATASHMSNQVATWEFPAASSTNVIGFLAAGEVPDHWSTYDVDVVVAAAGTSDSGNGVTFNYAYGFAAEGSDYSSTWLGGLQAAVTLGGGHVRKTGTIATGLSVPLVSQDMRIRVFRDHDDASDTATDGAHLVQVRLRRAS